MTGVGLVFSATSGKVAALCFVLTILISLQWNELELCAKQRQEKKRESLLHFGTLWCIILNCREIANRTFTLNLIVWSGFDLDTMKRTYHLPQMRSVGVTLSHSPSGIRY